MAKEKFNEEDGVWRTIGGRKVFIRKGQNLADAMIESGKFKTKGKMRENYRKAKQELTDSEEDKEIKGRIDELQREIESGRNDKEKTERLKEELQQYKDTYKTNEKAREKQIDEEKRIKAQLDKERESWTDDDYAKRNRDIQDMKKKAQETFEKTLEEARMSGNDKLEESARRSREETLRDIDKLEKENRANYDEYRKNKSTNNDYVSQSKEFAKEHYKDFDNEDYEKSLNKYMTEHGELGGIQGNFLVYNSDENDFYKAKLEHDKEYLKNKSTNETMNNAIREKASKKNYNDGEVKINTTINDNSKNDYSDFNDKATANFGKIDYNGTGRKVNGVSIDLELKDGVFSASGSIKNGRGTDSISGGQNIDEIAELMKGNKDVQEIHDLWKKYHLNDMHAGTEKQEEALEKKFGGVNASKYDEQVAYLKSIGLYEDNGYKFGTGWLKREIPNEDKKRIVDLINKYNGKTNESTNETMNNAIRKQANIKNEYKQYLKDHPESKMSLSEFKKKNK